MAQKPIDLPRTIEAVYQSALMPSGMDALAGVLAQHLDTESGFLALLRVSPNALPEIVGLPSATANFDDWARSAYAEHYHACNVWFAEGSKRGFPAVLLGQELVSEAALTRSEWFEYCKRLDAFHVLGAQFMLGGDLAVQFGAHRPRAGKPFEEKQRRELQVLLPHLQRVIQIQQALSLAELWRQAAGAVFEALDVGVFVLGAGSEILYANATAERVLAERRGLGAAGGKLRALRRAERMRLTTLVAEAAATTARKGIAAGGLAAVTDASGDKTMLLVSPLPLDQPMFGVRTPCALVVVKGSASHEHGAAAALRRGLGLTEAEILLLHALSDGLTLAEHAERRGVSVGTIRTHLKRLLHKTGYHRQVDLVRAFAQDPVLRLALQLS